MKPNLTTAVSVAELMMGRYFCHFWRQIYFMVIKNKITIPMLTNWRWRHCTQGS